MSDIDAPQNTHTVHIGLPMWKAVEWGKWAVVWVYGMERAQHLRQPGLTWASAALLLAFGQR